MRNELSNWCEKKINACIQGRGTPVDLPLAAGWSMLNVLCAPPLKSPPLTKIKQRENQKQVSVGSISRSLQTILVEERAQKVTTKI